MAELRDIERLSPITDNDKKLTRLLKERIYDKMPEDVVEEVKQNVNRELKKLKERHIK